MTPLDLIFVHAPKTGSTSLIPAMRAKFGAALLGEWGVRPLDPEGPRWSAPEELLAADRSAALGSHRAVTGHFWAAKYAGVPVERRATILREPVARLISHYYFWQTRPSGSHALHSRFLREKPSLEAFAGFWPMPVVYSQAFFGGCDMHSFTYVGQFGDLSQYWASVLARLGLTHEPLHSNRTDLSAQVFGPPRAEVENDTALLSRLRGILRDDVDFYERWSMPL